MIDRLYKPPDVDTALKLGLTAQLGKIAILGDIVEVLTGVEDGDLSDIGTWVASILNVTGVNNILADLFYALADAINNVIPGPPGDIAEDYINRIADGINTTESTASGAATAANAAQAQITTVQQIFSVRSNRPLWEGVDPTGEASFPFVQLAKVQQHNHGLSGTTNSTGSHVGHSGVSGSAGDHQHTMTNVTVGQAGFSYVSATSALVPGACIRCESPNEKKQISFLAYKTGTVSAFYMDVYKMNADGSWALLHSTASKHGDLLTALSWMQFEITPQLTELGDVIGVQFRVGGTGTVFIAGIELPAPAPLPGFRPNNIGFIRTTNSAPSTISTAEMDAAYSAYTPYIQIGSDVGQLNAPRNFYDNANRSTGVGANWAQISSWSTHFTISSNQFAYSGTTDGWQGGVYVLPLVSDNVWVEMDVNGTSETSSLILCANSGLTNYATVDVDSGGTALFSATAINSGTSRATSGTGGTGRYRLAYNIADNTFRWYKYIGGTLTQLGTWLDSGNVVTHGSGKRFAGLKIQRNFFNNGGPVDNWNAADVVV